ncbi:MAG TPA: ABC transporter permease, partial [Phycisphaerales bacterium]|nr:ABC transporter permease [Phycisphaerales bacterium]
MLVRRVLMIPVLLWVIYTVTFVLAWMVPGNPIERGEGRRPSEEIIEAMKAQYRLDSPWSFYWNYLGNVTGVNYLRGRTESVIDLGPSLAHENWTVNEILASGLPVSIELGFAAILLAVIIGVSTGAVGALQPGSAVDFATYVLPLIGVSLPAFVIGTALLMIFGVWWPVFPIARWGGISGLVLPAV